jgi:hypothetical protein
LVVDVDPSASNLYRLWDTNRGVLYTGSSIQDLSQTIDRETKRQNRAAVELEVNGRPNDRDAVITSLSIQQPQIDSRIFITPESFSGIPPEIFQDTASVSLFKRSGRRLKSLTTTIRSNVSKYRERRRTDRIIRRGIKNLKATHPATNNRKFRKEAGRTRLVSIPRAGRTAESCLMA